MTDTVRILRERIARTRINRRGYRQYSEELRRDIRIHALMGLERGASYKDSARELGLPAATLQNWCRDVALETAEPKQPMGFRPVEVSAEHSERIKPVPEPRHQEAASQPVVVLPNGVRIEGLSVTALSRLLKELGWR